MKIGWEERLCVIVEREEERGGRRGGGTRPDCVYRITDGHLASQRDPASLRSFNLDCRRMILCFVPPFCVCTPPPPFLSVSVGTQRPGTYRPGTSAASTGMIILQHTHTPHAHTHPHNTLHVHVFSGPQQPMPTVENTKIYLLFLQIINRKRVSENMQGCPTVFWDVV